MSEVVITIIERLGLRNSSKPGGKRAAVHPLLAVALEAAFVTLVATAAHELGIFDRADQYLYAKVSQFINVVSEPQTTPSSLVFEIDQAMFDTEFKGTSPLPSQKLADVIRSLAGTERRMAIDLDLSPRGEELAKFRDAFTNRPPTCDDFAPRDRADDKYWWVEKALCGAQARLVLLTPFPVDTNADAAAKFRWMQFVCSIDGMEFAFPDVPQPAASYSVEYFKGPWTLAGTLGEDAKYGLCDEVRGQDSEPSENLPIEFSFLNRALVRAGFDPLRSKYIDTEHKLRLNFRLRLNVVPLSDCWSKEVPCIKQAEQLPDAETPLFLGGKWDSNGADEFMSPLGPIPGVELHALALAGEVNEIGLFSAVVIEFLVGVGLLIAFRTLWKKADLSLTEFVEGDGPVTSRLPDLGRYFVSVMLVPTFALLIALAILGVTAVHLSAYKWMAPVALLFSLLAKSYLEKETKDFNDDWPGWIVSRFPYLLIALVALLIVY